MAILAKCEKCGRKGGYAKSAEDVICYRCKLKEQKAKKKHE